METKDLQTLENLVSRIKVANSMRRIHDDDWLSQSLQEEVAELKKRYGAFLQDRLFDIYDDYFSDNQMQDLEDYILGDVRVSGDELDQNDLRIRIKCAPLRVEVENPENRYHQVMWEAA